MRRTRNWLAGIAGICCGLFGAMLFTGSEKPAHASSGDRFQDYIMCTGAVSVNGKVQTDGVWMLDYRGGKLVASVIDRTTGKMGGWAEVDLVSEFGIPPKTDVHFMMTTGQIAQGQAALYVCEVATGKFGVYTMGSSDSGVIQIRRHDLTNFRGATKTTSVLQASGTEQK
ncbi:hypothetical protein [Zavarzinella formosa]|uniref:hypothetical protein n=1 Tax=Zavarzinella formosa TaxID=360055 RepID=UPI0003185AB9|nr:hypothetical protein [Zavarzinella formosa]